MHPKIRRKNLYRKYIAKARSIVDEWAQHYPGIESIMLTGGVSRGYADELSELDFTLFLSSSTFRNWVLRCEAPMPEGDYLLKGVWLDVAFTTIKTEQRAKWEPLKIWDASSARILFDRRGRLRKLLKRQVRFSVKPWDLSQEAIETNWFVELGEGWIDRTDPIAAHHLLNLAFDRFLGLLFTAQDEIPPYGKWIFNLSRSLPQLPPEYESTVEEWLTVRSFSEADVHRRARAAQSLLDWWKTSFPESWVATPIRDVLGALYKGPMTFSVFKRKFGARCLLRFPLRAVTSTLGNGDHRVVRLEEGALRQTLRDGYPGMHPFQLKRLREAVEALSWKSNPTAR